jgi:CBS domain-containing protein
MNIASILATKGGQVFTVRPEQSIRQALALLAEHNVGALVAVDAAGRPVGIVSERDIVRHLAKSEVFADSIASIMTREVIVGAPNDDLGSVGHTMVEQRIRHLPVTDGEKLIGIISIGDVLKAQRNQLEGEVDTLQVQLIESQRQDKVFKH